MRINVHAGHNPDGKVACGAIGFISESTEARKVKNEVIRLLQTAGHIVYDTTCDNGTSQSDVLTRIVSMCNAHEVDLDVSIHFNSGAGDSLGNGKTTGTEAFIYNSSSKAKPYAEKVCAAIAELGYTIHNQGVKCNSSLYVLNKTKAPAMLIECCFVDDRDDVALYDYQSMAAAIVYGITGQRVTEIAPPAVTADEEASAPGAETAIGDSSQLWRVQVGAFRKVDNADNLVAELRRLGYSDAFKTRA